MKNYIQMVGLPPPPSSSTHTTISAVYQDILQTHILTRLDGPALASVACTSSQLQTISKEDKLWEKICTSTWPSINDPLVSRVVTTFPTGHRSFFSEAYPLIHHHSHSSDQTSYPVTPTELISAVDVYYRNVPIFSKVEQTETVSGWFRSSPFRVDLLGPKEFVPTWVRQVGGTDTWLHQVEQNLIVSWILMDPKEKRAMNISSQMAVSGQRHWLTGEVQVKFATVLAGGGGSWEKEYVECEVVVRCGGKEGGEVQVREVSLGMADMEGKALNGKDSLEILKEAMERGERRKPKDKDGKEAKERYKEFLERKRERKDRSRRKEKVIDWVCIATGVIINCFVASWSYMLLG